MKTLIFFALVSVVCGMPNLQNTMDLITGQKEKYWSEADVFGSLIADKKGPTCKNATCTAEDPCDNSKCNKACKEKENNVTNKKYEGGYCGNDTVTSVYGCCCGTGCTGGAQKIATVSVLMILYALAVCAIPSFLHKA